jgi:outer membrane protein
MLHNRNIFNFEDISLKKQALAVALTLLTGTQPIFADNLSSLYQVAKQADPTLRSAEYSMLSVKESVPQAISSILPSVSSSYTYSARQRTDTEDTFYNRNYEFSLSQDIVNIPSILAIGVAKQNAKQAVSTFRAAEQDLMVRLAESYLNTLKARDELNTARAKTKAFGKAKVQTQQRFEVGLVAITDVHEAKARHDNALATEVKAQNSLLNQKEKLSEIVGIPVTDVAPLKDSFKPKKPEPDNIDYWVNAALENNHTLKAAHYGVVSANRSYRQETSSHLPTVSLAGSLTRDFPTSLDSATYNKVQSMGFTVTLPLFSGGLTLSRIRQARHNYDSAKEDQELTRRSTESATRQAYRGVLTQIRQVKALKQAVVSNQSAYKATDAAFKAGTRTIVDVLNAQSDLLDAKQNLKAARYDYILEYMKLKRASGRLAQQDIDEVNAWLKGIA